MIPPSTHESRSILLNVQIHFSVILLSFNLILLLPDDEFCTIHICIYLFIFLAVVNSVEWHCMFLKSMRTSLEKHYLQRR